MFKSKYLYVGSGSHIMEGFIHADISVYKLSKVDDPNKRKIDIICDITESIPLPDDSIEVIFSSFDEFGSRHKKISKTRVYK